MTDVQTKIILQTLQSMENDLKKITATLADYDRNTNGDNEYFQKLRIEMAQLRKDTAQKFTELKNNVNTLAEI